VKTLPRSPFGDPLDFISFGSFEINNCILGDGVWYIRIYRIGGEKVIRTLNEYTRPPGTPHRIYRHQRAWGYVLTTIYIPPYAQPPPPCVRTYPTFLGGEDPTLLGSNFIMNTGFAHYVVSRIFGLAYIFGAPF
jgi:hypothetical protein